MNENLLKTIKITRNATFTILLVILAIIFVTPYVWMFLSSFRPSPEIFKYASPFTWKTIVPLNVTLENYYDIFVNYKFGRNLLNSVIVAALSVTGTVIVSSLAGYIFARVSFFGRELAFGFVMLSALIPFEVIMIPLYIVVKKLGLADTLFALFIPWIANPFGIFLMRQAFMELPKEFDEAAVVEGANHFQIFMRVLLPNIKPTIITLALMSFLWSWNSFLWPLIAISKMDKQLIQVAIATYTLPQQAPMWGNIFAASAIATVPILILFIVLQKYYISGAVMSGIKG